MRDLTKEFITLQISRLGAYGRRAFLKTPQRVTRRTSLRSSLVRGSKRKRSNDTESKGSSPAKVADPSATEVEESFNSSEGSNGGSRGDSSDEEEDEWVAKGEAALQAHSDNVVEVIDRSPVLEASTSRVPLLRPFISLGVSASEMVFQYLRGSEGLVDSDLVAEMGCYYHGDLTAAVEEDILQLSTACR
ncbi:hypothetical protein GUJ93_ZPchr0003g17280 [Zizania palustris]|uniref:Uncharacterized protein n=1 Tax=Zizania palustris TaxID=103762 RepID=A0A8J5ST32_ZIZPA|nr:hypothetical protein GUJ93_ZPchr0003g17280 [Zizania palustris]